MFEYDLQLRKLDVDQGDRITRALDLDGDPEVLDQRLLALLKAGVIYTGGDLSELDQYALHVFEHGKPWVVRVFAAAPEVTP